MKIPLFGEGLPGLSKIKGVIAQFEAMSADLNDGIAQLNVKKEENLGQIQSLESQNRTIADEVSTAQYVLKQINGIVNRK
jgi:hypothetical protein